MLLFSFSGHSDVADLTAVLSGACSDGAKSKVDSYERCTQKYKNTIINYSNSRGAEIGWLVSLEWHRDQEKDSLFHIEYGNFLQMAYFF